MLTKAAALFLVALLSLGALLVTGQPAHAASSGLVLTMSNGSRANKVLAWARSANGALAFAGQTATGGRGSGGQLNNQGGLALSPDGDWLYVVNAGSDSLSVFSVSGTTLTLTDVEPTRGDKPISVTADESLVYVLNAGGRGNVRGFRRDGAGRLTYISGRGLSARKVVPAQIGFNPAGTRMYVTERRTNRITRFKVRADGTAGSARSSASAGAEPFGFEFAPNGTLVVSEAGNHVEDGSSASSYRFGSGGTPIVVSGAVPTTETAACWTAVTPDGRFAYVTNTPDHSISGFAIAANGSLTLLDANGRTAATGSGSFPIDLDTSSNGDYLYALAAGTHRILVYAVAANGSLVSRPGVGGLPGAANGLVAR